MARERDADGHGDSFTGLLRLRWLSLRCSFRPFSLRSLRLGFSAADIFAINDIGQMRGGGALSMVAEEIERARHAENARAFATTPARRHFYDKMFSGREGSHSRGRQVIRDHHS